MVSLAPGTNRWTRSIPPTQHLVKEQGTDLSIEGLIREAEQAPSKKPVVARVLQVADDPNASAVQLGSAIGGEPALASRVMRTANSTFYGVSGRVNTLQFAVSVLGFTTIRALAASAVLGLGERDVPKGFWEFSAAHGVASGLAATRLSVPSADAFCAGLLSGMGRAVLYRSNPSAYDEAIAEATHPREYPDLEKAWSGYCAPEVSARIFAAWKFPKQLVAATGSWHLDPATNPPALADPIARSVRVGFELAARIVGFEPADDLGDLSGGRISEEEGEFMVVRCREQAEHLKEAFLA